MDNWHAHGHGLIKKSVREQVALKYLLAPYTQRFTDPEARVVVCGAVGHALSVIGAAIAGGARFGDHAQPGRRYCRHQPD